MEPGKKGTMVRIILSHTRRDRPLAFILKERKVHGELAAGKTTWSGTQRSHVCGSEADGSEELGGNEASEETSTTSDGEVYLTSGSSGGSGLGSGPTRERFQRWSRQVGRPLGIRRMEGRAMCCSGVTHQMQGAREGEGAGRGGGARVERWTWRALQSIDSKTRSMWVYNLFRLSGNEDSE